MTTSRDRLSRAVTIDLWAWLCYDRYGVLMGRNSTKNPTELWPGGSRNMPLLETKRWKVIELAVVANFIFIATKPYVYFSIFCNCC